MALDAAPGSARLPPSVAAGLAGILSAALGAHAGPWRYRLIKALPDYYVVGLRGPRRLTLLAKMAGPAAPLPGAFDRTAMLEARVVAETGLRLPETLAVDTSCRTWPWRYVVKRYEPGTVWAALRGRLPPEEQAAALTEIGRAVAALHAVRFPAFGEIDGTGAVAGPADFATALAGRAARQIRDPAAAARFQAVLAERAPDLATVGPPCLCHEDLHGANLIFRRAGGRWHLTTVLDFDKAWAGAAEIDLARLELWRGMSGPGFWAGYGAVPQTGYPARRALYQLMWCLEYAAPTVQHRADTAAVCAALGIPPIPAFT